MTEKSESFIGVLKLFSAKKSAEKRKMSVVGRRPRP